MATTLHPLPIHLQLPRPPGATNGIALSKELRSWLDDSVSRWDRELVRALEARLAQMTSLINELIAGNGLVSFDSWFFQDELVGERNDSNTLFTFPHPPRIGLNGVPMATVFWKTGLMLYSPTDPPPSLQWSLVDSSTMRLTPPPHEGDSLMAYVISES